MKKLSSFRFIWGVPILAIGVAAVLGGCQRAVSTPEEDESSRMTIEPAAALIGTWQTVHEERDDNGNVTATTTFALTFTKTRAILLHTERDSDGKIIEADWCQCESATWEANNSTITKTRVPWLEDAPNPYNDELGFWGSEKISVDRDYVFVDDAKTVLLIHPWEGHEATETFERYTRIENPIPSGSATGMWEGEVDWPRGPDEELITRWTFSFGESFTEHALETRTATGAPTTLEEFIVNGSAIHDTEDYVFSVTVESHTRTIDGAPANTRILPGHVLRYAYAPTGNPDEIAVSLWWSEQDYDPETQTWIDRETSADRPIFADGRYRVRLKPVTQ